MSSIIVGVSSISLYGDEESEVIDNLKNERVKIREYNSEDKWQKTTAIATLPEDLSEYNLGIPKSMAIDSVNLTWVSVLKALSDANIDLDRFKDKEEGLRIALVSAQGTVDGASIRRLTSGNRPSTFDMLKILPTAVSGPIATLLGLRGTSHTVQHACASGTMAIARGMDLIALNKADIVVCTSVERCNEETIRGFAAMKALYRGDDVKYASAPFSKHRQGFVSADAAGCVILESNEVYNKRPEETKRNYGRCVDYSDYSDGFDLSNPSGLGAEACMRKVLRTMEDQGLTPDFVSAHATSTVNGDTIEAGVIHDVLGPNVPVVSLKRLLGHTLTASGILETILCLYMMREQFIISNGGLDVDESLPKINLPNEQIHTPIDSFIKNSFGFGGLNCVLGVARHV